MASTSFAKYLAALAASGLKSKRHRRLKTSTTNKWVTERIDILPMNLVELHKMTKGYVDEGQSRTSTQASVNRAADETARRKI